MPPIKLDTGYVSNYVATKAVGNAGDIFVKGKSLLLNNGAEISTITYGRGNAGSVFLQAEDSVSLGTQASILSNVSAQGVALVKSNPRVIGDSGGITIRANSLSLTNGAKLIASTFAQGRAGSISVQADNFVSLIGGSIAPIPSIGLKTLPGTPSGILPANIGDGTTTGIFSTVESGARGNAGDIKIYSQFLTLTNGSEVQSLTRGEGNAGNIQVNALNFVNISGFSDLQVAESDERFIGGFSSGLITATEGEASGLGGNIELTTDALRVSDGGVLNARTRSARNGGNITVNTNNLELTGGGQLLTSTISSGSAGNIIINANDSVNISGSDPTFAERLEQFSEAIVDNDGSNSGLFARVRGNATANAGKIEANARSIRLDKQGTITTETTLGEGGDIILKVKDILLLRNNSTITATAGTAEAGGNGGNITINAPSGFIVAVPRENSDITANAYTGNGGRVDIQAFGIYGIQPRSNPTSFSDITASSEFGVNGTVELNTPDIDPNNGLVNLPTVPVDTQVAQTCTADSTVAKSSFTITGRGGLPPNPGEALNTDAVQVDLVTLNPNNDRGDRRFVPSKITTPAPEPIIEAIGLALNQKGEVVLTANLPTTTPHSPWLKPASCRAIRNL